MSEPINLSVNISITPPVASWDPPEDPISAWWLGETEDPYSLSTMRTADDGSGDPVEINDAVGWAEDVV